MKLQVKEDSISQKLLEFKTKLESRNFNRSIGNIAYADILRNFKTQGKNIKEPWPKLSPLTESWRRKGQKKGAGNKALSSSDAAPFGIHLKTFENRVEIRTNYVKNGKDIARIQNAGVPPYTPTAKQKAWFRYHGVFLKKDTKLSIPQRLFMEVSDQAKKEIHDFPALFVRELKR